MDLFDIVAARQSGKGGTVDSALNENSTNAIQNAVVAKEVQRIKNVVNGARVVYVDLPKPTPRDNSYSTSNGTSTEYVYTTEWIMYISYFDFVYDKVTQQAQITENRTNLPPVICSFTEGGSINMMKYKCEFLHEAIILDLSKIEPEITEYTPEPLYLTELKSLAEDLGGTFSLRRYFSSPVSSRELLMCYHFRFDFPDEETRSAFSNEYVPLLLNAWCGMFTETYIPETTPEEVISEVI